MSATKTRRRAARLVAVAGGIAAIVALAVVFFPKAPVGLADCAGRTGPAAVGVPYTISIRADAGTVRSTIDFDGRLWGAVDDQVTRDGLVPASATVLDGAVTLVNHEEATFSSPAAYATLLPLTPADGCAGTPVARSGRPLPRP
jgi:hypothetical protein